MRRLAALAVAFLMLVSAVSAADPDVNLLKTEPVPVKTGEYADVWVEVVNNDTDPAENVTVEFEPTYPFSVDPDEETSWKFREIDGFEENQVHLQVRVDENAVEGESELKFWVESDDTARVTERLPVQVRSDDNLLEVSGVEFPGTVRPGSTNTMELELRNRADSSLKNIDVSLDLSTTPFATVETTRKRVQRMETGAEESVEFDLLVDGDADNGLYKIPVLLEYENRAGTEFTLEQSTGIVVGGEEDLEVGVEERELLQPGTTGTVTLRIVNRGDGKARFVSLKIQDSETHEVVSSRSVYLGDMQPDDYQTAEFRIYAARDASGLSLPVELDYTAPAGVQESENRNVEIKLYGQDEMRRYGLSSGGNVIMYLAAAAVLAGLTFFYWRRRKR